MSRSRIALVGAVVAVLTLTACDQGYKDESKVLAKVNGEAITEAEYQHYRQALAEQQRTVIEDNEQNRKLLVDQLVFNHLLVQEAKNQKLHQQADTHFALKIRQDEILIGAVANNYLQNNPVTDAEITEQYAELKKTRDYKLRHILVKDEQLARDIIAKLEKKGSFSALAKKHTLHDQTRNKGGDLGWVGRDFVVPAIYLSAEEFGKKGLLPKPVKSVYGWHVVQVDGERAANIPPLKEIRPALVDSLRRKKVGELGEFLRKGAKVELVGK